MYNHMLLINDMRNDLVYYLLISHFFCLVYEVE
jgi:hypothetical protein